MMIGTVLVRLKMIQGVSSSISKIIVDYMKTDRNDLVYSFPHLVIVLSSDWRKDERGKHSLSEIRQIFSAHAWLAERIVDTTQETLTEEEENLLCDEEEDRTASQGQNHYRNRGSLIDEYIRRHGLTVFGIFDDMNLGASCIL